MNDTRVEKGIRIVIFWLARHTYTEQTMYFSMDPCVCWERIQTRGRTSADMIHVRATSKADEIGHRILDILDNQVRLA